MLTVCVLLGPPAWSASAQPPVPPGWPLRLELGMMDGPGGAGRLRQTAPFAFRYQYLAGGVNTGNGWSTWNTNGDFPRLYIEESIAAGAIPVFSYYMLLQSSPGGGSESDADFTNVNNVSTMTAYYNDLRLFFQKAGAFPSHKVVLHVEPDFWGFMQQRATGDDARTVSAKVSETGVPQLAGLPGTVAGFAQAIVKLRDGFAPNVILGYHLSVWGTRVDIGLQDPDDATLDRLAARAAAFYASLQANFDVVFAEFADRDAAFSQHIVGEPRRWWDAADFRRHVRFLGGFSTRVSKRLVMWQIPLGNTRMLAQNNTWGHFQDNRPEWLLDEPLRSHLAAYRDSGVVALLFGGGASGTTCACDGQNDGVTNAASVGGTSIAAEAAPQGTAPALVMRGSTPTLVSPYAADDDGGFFRWKAWEYYRTGAMPLPEVNTPAPSAPTGFTIVR